MHTIEQRKLGKSGLAVPALGIGIWSWGETARQSACLANAGVWMVVPSLLPANSRLRSLVFHEQPAYVLPHSLYCKP